MNRIFEILIKNLPKGINEWIFAGGIAGVVVLLCLKKRKITTIYLKAIVLSIIFMILWRTIVGANRNFSSRYFSVLIYPFSIFTAIFLSEMSQKNHRIIWGSVFLVIIINMLTKTFKRYDTNHPVYNIVEFMQRVDSSDNNILYSKKRWKSYHKTKKKSQRIVIIKLR